MEKRKGLGKEVALKERGNGAVPKSNGKEAEEE